MSELGRYSIYGNIAHGGMATVHLGRLKGAAGFERTVAIKRLHPQYAMDPSFVDMFTDEARVASRIQHPNVVSTLDVVQSRGELFLVLEYIHGETLDRLTSVKNAAGRRELSGDRVSPGVAAAIMVGTLNGLHAAHEATDARGEPLLLVHRDVSPHNIIVGADGVPRVLDFGIAKATGQSHCTQDGFIKGKIAYMPPEQLYGERLDRRADVYAAGIVLWELLTGQRLFAGEDFQPAILKLVDPVADAPSARVRARLALSEEQANALPEYKELLKLDAVVLKALEEDPESRYQDALEFARAIQQAVPPAQALQVSEWMRGLAQETLGSRAAEIHAIERGTEVESLWTVEGTNPELLAQARFSLPPTATLLGVGVGGAASALRESTRMGLGPEKAPRPRTAAGTELLAPSALHQLAANQPRSSEPQPREPQPREAPGLDPNQSGSWAATSEVYDFPARRRSARYGLAALAAGTIALFAVIISAWESGAGPAAELAGAAGPTGAVELTAAQSAQPQQNPHGNLSEPAAPTAVNMAPVFVGPDAPEPQTAALQLDELAAEPVAAKPAARRWLARKAAAKAPAAKQAAAAPRKVDCATPFVIDAQGHKRYKRECF